MFVVRPISKSDCSGRRPWFNRAVPNTRGTFSCPPAAALLRIAGVGAKIIFITGTDTGVGKTVLTALLLSHLRSRGCHALAMKPFCSGSQDGVTDVDILHKVQGQALATHEINPFFFPEPLAPLVAARRHRLRITLDEVLQRIRSVIDKHLFPIEVPDRRVKAKARRTSKIERVLLIEGAGGLLAPLGEGFNLLDIIFGTASSVMKAQGSGSKNRVSSVQTLITARNQLGTINHTLLTVHALQTRFVEKSSSHVSRSKFQEVCAGSVVLMNPERTDESSSSNPQILAELVAPIPVHSIAFLGDRPLDQGCFENNVKKLRKNLNEILNHSL